MKESKTWGFIYITMDAMNKANPDYDPNSGKPYEIADSETFYSKSSDFLKACKEFDEFEDTLTLWDVDPEVSFNYGEEYRLIEGIVKYNRF